MESFSGMFPSMKPGCGLPADIGIVAGIVPDSLAVSGAEGEWATETSSYNILTFFEAWQQICQHIDRLEVKRNQTSKTSTSKNAATPYGHGVLSQDAIALHYVPKFTTSKTSTSKIAATPYGHGVLSEDAIAVHNVPKLTTSTMDGYSMPLADFLIAAANPHETFTVLGNYIPGEPVSELPKEKPENSLSCAYVATGAALPEGHAGVIPVEHVSVSLKNERRSVAPYHDLVVATKVIRISEPFFKAHTKDFFGLNTREPGSDISEGKVVVPKGTVYGSTECAALATAGIKEFHSMKPIDVALIITGSEIVPMTYMGRIEPHLIEDANGRFLLAECTSRGWRVESLEYIKDSKVGLSEIINTSVERDVDLIIVTGGVSMGQTDMVKPVISELGKIVFGRVALKPGLPTTFGYIADSCPIFGLPGNPCSVWAMFQVLVVPCVQRILAIRRQELPSEASSFPHSVVPVELATDVVPDNKRLEFQRCIVAASELSGETALHQVPKMAKAPTAHITGLQRSSCAKSLVGANGLLLVPSKEETGQNVYPKGSLLNAILLKQPVPHDAPILKWWKSEVAVTDGPMASTGTRNQCQCGTETTAATNGEKSNGEKSNGQGVTEGLKLHSSHLHAKALLHTPSVQPWAVVVISDRVHCGEAVDCSGVVLRETQAALPLLQECLASESLKITVPDEVLAIQAAVLECHRKGATFIVTTGGTGLTVRDVTPQAVEPLLHYRCRGMETAVLQEGLKHTSLAALSRVTIGVMGGAVCGKEASRGKRSLVACLPGSTAGAREGLQALAPFLSHALQTLSL